MADDTTESTETGTEETNTSDQLGEAGKKALDAERRNAKAAAKERDALAARLQEFEDRDKSEIQRASERAEAAEKRAADLEVRALRLEVASEQGLTTAQARRLVGETREELEADARDLLETFKSASQDDSTENVTDSLDLGTRGGTPKKGKSSADLFAAAIEGSFSR